MNPFDYVTAADYVALGAIAVVFVAGVYLVILLGDLPTGIAEKRNHPQLAAVQAMSWLGLLFTGGIVLPIQPVGILPVKLFVGVRARPPFRRGCGCPHWL
jgi:hypothetical protein